MAQAYSKALNRSIQIKRILGKVKGDPGGPTIIFIAGMHGNEPSGVFALREIINSINDKKLDVNGNLYAIVGNIKALDQGIRYIEEDLNRMWTDEEIEKLDSVDINTCSPETLEQVEIYTLLQNLLSTENGPFYFIDLHTTSSKTIPFTLVNDSLLNRRFVSQYPLPMILGIEEYLSGPLLSYVNELGYVSFGYESGQHDELSSIDYHIAFIYLTLVFGKLLDKDAIDFDKYFTLLSDTSDFSGETYEIFETYKISNNENFQMNPGFENFQPVSQKQELAKSNEKSILASNSGRIFMPLYQSHGGEGFFIIRKIPDFFLHLSSFTRKVKLDRLLPFLPGVSIHPDKKDTLLVDRKVARFFAKQFFHLLGYRSQHISKTHLIINNRETYSKRREYPSFK